MAYEKQHWDKYVWEKGQENLEARINHMEDGIASAGGGGADYTPGFGININNNTISANVDEIAALEYVDNSITSALAYVDQQDAAEHAGRVAGDVWEKTGPNNGVQVKDTGCSATANGSVAEGVLTHAGAEGSHAEGCSTATRKDNEAEALYSHVEGLNNGTNNVAEHGEGKYGWSYYDPNDTDGSKSSIHYVGIGTSDDESSRKDAETIMLNGDKYLIGVGGYDGKNIESAQTVQSVINSGATGLIKVIEDLNLANFNETDKAFYGSADNITLPNDFFSNPFKYNLVVSIHGTADDFTGIGGYTANHFCYLTDNNMWLCGDKFNFDEGMVDHFTSVNLSDTGHLEISYLGLMEGADGDRASGNPLIKDCYATVLLQKLY